MSNPIKNWDVIQTHVIKSVEKMGGINQLDKLKTRLHEIRTAGTCKEFIRHVSEDLGSVNQLLSLVMLGLIFARIVYDEQETDKCKPS